jgi:hypothetical protein
MFLYVVHSDHLLSSKLGNFFSCAEDVSSLEGLPVAEIGPQVGTDYGQEQEHALPKQQERWSIWQVSHLSYASYANCLQFDSIQLQLVND